MIAELARRRRRTECEQPSLLLGCEPLAKTDAEPAHAFHAPNPGRQLGTEQAGIGRFVCDAADGGEPQVDRRGRIVLLFEVDPVAKHDRTVEREPRLRALPGDGLSDRMVVGALTLADVKLLTTAAFESSRSGRAKTRFGAFLRRDFCVDWRIGDGLLSVAEQLHSRVSPRPLHRS